MVLVLKSVSSPNSDSLIANAIAEINPTTGLDSNKTYFSLSRTLSFTFQSVITDNDTVDVNVVTA